MMDKIRYDVNEDPSGAKGISLADIVLQRRRYSKNTPSFKEKSSIKKALREILPHTPKDISASPNVNSLVREDLRNIKKEGYEVNEDFNKMKNPTGLWNYYIKVLKENHYFDSS